MEEGKRNQLESKLKELLKAQDQSEAKPKQPVASGTGNIIRRRQGEKDRRFQAAC